MANRIVKLPSGASLEIQPAEFRVAKNLYMVCAAEAKGLPMDGKQVEAFLKDLACTGLSSPKIEEALMACTDRCLYNGLKLDVAVFEKVELRQDYLPALFEIAQENIAPFTKGLYAKYGNFVQKIRSLLA